MSPPARHPCRCTGCPSRRCPCPEDSRCTRSAARGNASRPRKVGVLVQEQRLIVGPLVPVGPHQHPFARRDLPVLRFPSLHMGRGQQEIRVSRRFGGTVDDVHRRDQALDRQRVGEAVRVVLARQPVVRRVEMRAGVFAELQPVPGPERAVLSYSLMRWIATLGVFLAKSGGSFRSGVSGPSTPVKSTTSTPPDSSSPPECQLSPSSASFPYSLIPAGVSCPGCPDKSFFAGSGDLQTLLRQGRTQQRPGTATGPGGCRRSAVRPVPRPARSTARACELSCIRVELSRTHPLRCRFQHHRPPVPAPFRTPGHDRTPLCSRIRAGTATTAE